MKTPTKIHLGTRGSELALKQTEMVTAALKAARPELEVSHSVIHTTGDKRQDIRLASAGVDQDKGLFIKELEQALEAQEVDAAVHSLKDMPSELLAPFAIAAVLPRAPIEDVLITRHQATLMTLPKGARVGTSSVRRARQLAFLRPDLQIVEIRGNVPTRIRKCVGAEGLDAILLAAAGLLRLGLLDQQRGVVRIDEVELQAETLDCHTFLPAAGQGAVAVEILRGNNAVRTAVRSINDEATELRVIAEREFLRILGAGCHTPVGAHTWLDGHRLFMKVRVFSEQDSAAAPVEAQADAPSGSPLTLARRLGSMVQAQGVEIKSVREI
jgi:hydroxymethylbilane synthase